MSEYRVIAIGIDSWNYTDNIVGLPSVCDNDYLLSYFQTCGEILDSRVCKLIIRLRVQIIYDKKTGNPRGLGFLSFATEEATLKALELSGCVLFL